MEILGTEVPFTAKPIAETVNIVSLFVVHHNQLFTRKGKVSEISGTEKLNSQRCEGES